jgi:hypothetical protein
MSPRSLFAAAALVSLAAAQPAVTLVGGADQAGTPLIQRQVVCQPSTPLCGPILALPANRCAGGTAVDPIRQVVWDTDGVQLVSVLSTVNGGTCRVVCAPMAVPGVPAGAFAPGSPSRRTAPARAPCGPSTRASACSG